MMHDTKWNGRLQVLHRHLTDCASGQHDEQQHEELAMHLTRAVSTRPEHGGTQNMASFPKAVSDVFAFDDLLSPEDKALRYKVRAFMETTVAPVIADYWEKAEFPHALVPKLATLGLGGATLKGYGCAGQSINGAAITVVEMARVDASMSTFLMVHNSLAMLTIGLLGSEPQKAEWLPPMAALERVGCWALTEPTHGSDASGLQSTARRVDGGWLVTGRKRWIGNGTFADAIIVFAKDTGTGQINAFIVRKGAKGLVTTKIENKIALRCVQNADIHLDDVFVPDTDRLPGCNSFQDTNKILAISRIMVAWQPVGIAMGVFDMVSRYTGERTQFGAALANYQITQEKMARMLGSIQAMFLMAWRLNQLYEAGKMTHGVSSMVKAWNSLRAREVVALGREILGGNGILADFLVAKAFCDLEAIYTYEGTYEINALVAGREATGLAAFKAPQQRRK